MAIVLSRESVFVVRASWFAKKQVLFLLMPVGCINFAELISYVWK